MARQYIDVPLYTTINRIKNNNYTLSAAQNKTFCIDNKNVKPLAEFLDRSLVREDLGVEVGSDAYIEESKYYFIKTKALQEESYLLDINKESFQDIIPKCFIPMNLKKGDILISKDSNVGEVVILDRDYPNAMLCGGIYKLPITKNKYYLLAFMKSEMFRQQIDFLVPRGSTIRHGKTKFLECLIPMPNKNLENVIEYIELLMQAIINKEIEIQKKHEKILEEIEKELNNNQKNKDFNFKYPNFKEVERLLRLDSSLYSKEFKEKEFLIKNYKFGTNTVKEMGFEFIRGNNLAISIIGQSIYLDEYKPGFYNLIRPVNLSVYGTLKKNEYLGNKAKMIKIKYGDIVFGAEGTGRSLVVLDKDADIITNFHGLTLHQKYVDTTKSIFVKLFLDYLKKINMIDAYATGGNGGSLSISYWSNIPFPKFPEEKEKELVKLYHNPKSTYDASQYNLQKFLKYDNLFNEQAGIYELDKSMKYLKEKLEKAIDNIAKDKTVEIIF